jgi:hypothetical protein
MSLQDKCGKPESSLLSDIELLLEKLNFQCESYHGGDFNGVCCQRIVGNTANKFKELRTLLKNKKDESCEESTIDKKLDKLEMISGKGHQVRVKDNCRCAGLPNFKKKTASILKTRVAASHPPVVTCKNAVTAHSKQKKRIKGRKKLRRGELKKKKRFSRMIT